MRERIVAAAARGRRTVGDRQGALERAARRGSARSRSAPSTPSACRCSREFPLEADLDPGFDLADETEVPRIVEEALDRSLRILVSPGRRTMPDVALVLAQLGIAAHARRPRVAARSPARRLGRTRSLPRAGPVGPDAAASCAAVRRRRSRRRCRACPAACRSSSPTAPSGTAAIGCSRVKSERLSHCRRADRRRDSRRCSTGSGRTS